MSVIGEASRSHKLATVGVIEQNRYEVEADPIRTMSPIRHEVNPCAQTQAPGDNTHPGGLQPTWEAKIMKGLASGTVLLLARGELTVAADHGSLN
ncbi:hypothetical protein FPSE_09481 [Fusarium pseudograminearum CS3096]|uniref:Uncharacterized protein n=1 Tax=Fusarium pseudograminearum (strain CS3096) TaxID=1028729 RepID=K3VA08_FUSPC|nr:hypothetical protein FPSE_09481 [Fusarium pseudograminearum CS3096]EKJ70264.1 hypothetical protein FPSE_09481 [Fusarium pseudograminearum CS3096]